MSFSASLCAGVRMSDIVTTRIVEDRATKYSPDTGEPYTQKIKREVMYVLGKETPLPPGGPEEWNLIPGLEVMAVHSNAYIREYGQDYSKRLASDYDLSKVIIGKLFGKCMEDNEVREVTAKEVIETLDSVRYLFQKAECFVPVRVFVVTYCRVGAEFERHKGDKV